MLYPFAEIAALVTLAGHIGGGGVMLYILLSALLGIFMLRNQKIGALMTLGSLMNNGPEISLYSLLWPLRYTLAGVLFIVPGVISEIAAILLLLPLKGPKIAMAARPAPVQADDIIEGEYHRVDEPADPNRRLH
ncbi:FxsA family protein [Paludibacterium paludis]|nr:FxsA family protein [Paludibacterium paludis]